MKKLLLLALALLLGQIALTVSAQATSTAIAQGVSSTRPPYVLPAANGVSVTAIITATDAVSGYTMCGTPDGLGAWDNGNGSFTLLMNHEFVQSAGVARAHGGTGSFISKWIINKSNLVVVSGSDLIQQVHLNAGSGYTLTPAYTFTRFCSGDLSPVSAYWDPASGLGTQNRIYMNGEESGTEGRAFGHVASGPDAGKSYELPYLGKQAWENVVACPKTQTKTIVCLMDDTTPGQVFVYVGTKTNTGLDVDKAGLTNGKLYGISVPSMLAETNATFAPAASTFTLIDLGQVQSITGSSLNTMATNSGVTTFLRPEDGSWNPANVNEFYFNTTNAFNSPSRVWKLVFTNIAQPELGGTITAVLDGTEGQQMFDNMGIDHWGHILLQEDVGNNIFNGRMLQYTIATDALTPFAMHDPNLFVPPSTATLTQDEETSGVIDMEEILGPGWFLSSDQAHFAIAGGVVEGGQLFAIYNPTTAMSSPEINVYGGSFNIPDNSNTIMAGNNTDFGVVTTTASIVKTFTIQNIGQGPLVVSTLSISGAQASEFVLQTPPSVPFTLTANQTQILNIQFSPGATGSRSAAVNFNNNDLTESNYDFSIGGTGTVVASPTITGISNQSESKLTISLFPNPTSDAATLKITSDKVENTTITIVDTQGKLLLKVERELVKGEQTIAIPTATLSNGTYFVKTKTGSKQSSIKMIVAH
jgi:hypothetical protein